MKDYKVRLGTSRKFLVPTTNFFPGICFFTMSAREQRPTAGDSSKIKNVSPQANHTKNCEQLASICATQALIARSSGTDNFLRHLFHADSSTI